MGQINGETTKSPIFARMQAGSLKQTTDSYSTSKWANNASPRDLIVLLSELPPQIY